MNPLSDIGKTALDGNDWESYMKKSALAELSEDSDTIRERLWVAEAKNEAL